MSAAAGSYRVNEVVPFTKSPSLTGSESKAQEKRVGFADDVQVAIRRVASSIGSADSDSVGSGDEDELAPLTHGVRLPSHRAALPAWTHMSERDELLQEKRVIAMSFVRRKLPPKPHFNVRWRFPRVRRRKRNSKAATARRHSLGLSSADVGSFSDSELLLEDFAVKRGAAEWTPRHTAVTRGDSSHHQFDHKMLRDVVRDIRDPHHVAFGKIMLNIVTCIGYAFVASILPIAIMFAFSFTFLATVKMWRDNGHVIISDNPVWAAIHGEPFHELSTWLIVQNVLWLVVVCPVFCCTFKLAGHLYFIYGANLRGLLRNAFVWVGSMGIMQFACFATMAAGGVRVPRLVWMSLIFVFLFLGAWVAGGHVGKEMKDPSVRKYFFRHTVVTNVICYSYSIIGPWLFYRSGRAVQLAMLLGLHPLMEYTFFFMFLTDSTKLSSAHTRMLWVMCLHYTNILRLFETFLMLTFDDTTNTVLSIVASKLVQTALRVYSTGVYRLVHTRVLRRPKVDWDTFFGEKRFVSFSLDYDRAVFIADIACIVISSFCNLMLRFRGQTDALDVFFRMITALLVDVAKDVTVLYVLLQLGADWFHAFQTRADQYFKAVLCVVNASAVMFLFYMYSFLAANAEP